MGCGICIKWLALPSSYANGHWHFLHTVHPSWPLCSGPENHRTLATIKSPKQNNPRWNITILELQPSIWCSSDRISLKRLCCHLKGFDGQVFFVWEGQQHSSSAHLSSLSTFLQSSIHLSVHSSLHPSVHIAFVPHVNPSVMASAMPVLLYRHHNQPCAFFKLVKRHNSVQVTGSRNLRVQKNFLRRLQFGPLQWLKPSEKQFMLMNKLYWGASVGIRATLYPSDCVWYCFSIIMRPQTIAGKRKGSIMVEKNGTVFFWFRESTPMPAIPTPFFLILLPAQSFSLVKLWTH